MPPASPPTLAGRLRYGTDGARLHSTAVDSAILDESVAKKIDKLIDRESGVSNDPAEDARSKLFVIGNDDPGVRSVAPENHMAARLSPKDKAGALQGRAYFPAGQVGGKLGHLEMPTILAYAASTSTNSLPASVGIGSPASRQSST